MKTAIFIATLLCSVTSKGQEFNISGKIEYTDSLMILFGSEDHVDTLISAAGTFSFKRKTLFPELLTIAALDIKNKSVNSVRRFFAYNGSACLKTDFNNLGNCDIQMTNDRYNKIYEDFRERFNPLVSIARKVIDTSYSKQLTSEGKGLCNRLYDYIIDLEGDVIEKFIINNSDNIVGAFIFSTYYNTQANIAKAEKLLAGFSSNLLTCHYLKDVKTKINAAKKVLEGQSSPKIQVISLQGNEIALGQAQEKYTVIDFWGTWCAPCIKGMSKMKEWYQLYKNKVNFIGVAYNDNNNDVKRLINEQKIKWPQIVNNDQGIDLVKVFNVYAAPTKIVIDPKGMILRIFVGETEDFYTYIKDLK